MSTSDLIPKEALQKGYDSEAARIPELSGKMSELCKYVWAGSLALFYAATTSAKTDAAYGFYDSSKSFLLLAAICGSLALLAEYLQFALAYKHVVKFVAWIENNVKKRIPITYDDYNGNSADFFLAVSKFFFVTKNLLAIGSAALIAFAVIRFALA